MHVWRCANSSPQCNMVFFLGEREGIVHGPAIAAEICGVARDTRIRALGPPP